MTDPSDPVRTGATRTHDIALRRDGIVAIRCRPGVHQTVADANETIAAALELAGAKRPLLVDLRAPFTADPGVRERYGAQTSTDAQLALAILIGSGLGRVFGNLFLALAAHKTPVRIFTSEADACTWLRKFRPPPVDAA
jgi:hypothetical protein